MIIHSKKHNFIVLICFLLAGIFLLSSCGLFSDDHASDRTESIGQHGDGSNLAEKESGNSPTGSILAYTGPFAQDADAIIISQVYGPGNNTDAACPMGYIQLFNTSDMAVSLEGLSIYHRKGNGVFLEYRFADQLMILPRHYFLIRCASATGKDGSRYNTSYSIYEPTSFDASFENLHLDNSENTIVLGKSGINFNAEGFDFKTSSAVSEYFIGTELEDDFSLRNIHIAQGMSKHKIAVKTGLLKNSYYAVYNLTKLGQADLIRFAPQTSKGAVNDFIYPTRDEVSFSHQAGFYDQAFSLTLEAPAGYTIYYTIDGSTPTASSQKYKSPIFLDETTESAWGNEIKRGIQYLGEGAQPKSETMIGCHVIKAIGIDNETEASTDVITNTYVIIPNFADTYRVKVFSLTLPVRNWISAIGIYNRYNSSDPRPRSEAYLELFDESGERVGHSNIEVGVSGKYSASKLMKSLRFYYKGSLNEDNEGEKSLRYTLFGSYATDDNDAIISEFERLILRNGGNDCGVSYVRDAFSQRLGGLLGVDHMAYTPALLFVNGEFWGVYNCRERYETQFATDHYGILPENVTVMESDYSKVNRDNLADYVVSDGDPADGDNFNDIYHFIERYGVTDPESYAWVCDVLDVDSLIDMYVEHLILCGADWPHNNIKLWRNKNPDDPSGFDTKWHYALLDQDTTLSLSWGYSADCFANAFNYNSVTALIMTKLMKNQTFANRFYLRYYEAATEIYTPEKMAELYYEVYDSVAPLMKLQEIRWPGDFPGGVAAWEKEMEKIFVFLQRRQKYALSTFYAYFSIDEAYVLSLREEAGK